MPTVWSVLAASAGNRSTSRGQAEFGQISTTLSSTAKSLGDGNAEFDAAKVERVSNAIRDGKYQVNAEAIADKLISNAQELLSRGSH